jgi:2-phospho-L-lactate guanylyltransferase (CobY/MobA/RfbA family)
MGCFKRIALVPIKDFRTAKSRLAGVLSVGERQTLARWRFWRVLSQVRRSGLFSEVVVLSKGSLLQGSKEGFPVHVVEQDPRLELEEALNA